MEKERYNHFKAADFVLDDEFLAWVRDHDPQSQKNWELWLLENPEKQDEVDIARQIIQSFSFKTEPVEAPVLNQEWNIIRENMAENSAGTEPAEGSAIRRFFPVWARMLAASVVLVLAVWIGKDYLPIKEVNNPPLAEKKALNGQQLTVKLKDGTTIVLNAGSTLSYPEHFPKNSREVQLTGEAYFEVAPNPDAPFMIFTEGVRVEVIGTRFTVKAYPENESVKVAVVEGKVSVNPSVKNSNKEGLTKNEIFLTKDEMATIEKDKREVLITSYDKNDLLGWKNGVLYFEKADFPQLVNKLERWYGVKVNVDTGVNIDSTWRFSGKFENKSIDYILEVCRYPNRFSYELSENKVFINK